LHDEWLAVAEAIQKQSVQALPVAFEDHERAFPVEAVDLGRRLAVFVRDTELMELRFRQIGPKVQVQVQIG